MHFLGLKALGESTGTAHESIRCQRPPYDVRTIARVLTRRPSLHAPRRRGLPKTKIVIHGQGDLIESVEQPGRPKHTLLGERLRRAGLIDATQLRNALKGQKRQLVPIGEALLNEGLITQSDLDNALALQANEAIFQAFEWKEGTYRLELDSPEPIRRVVSLSSEELQVTAFRMLDEWPLIRSRINNYSVVYRRSSAQSDESEPNLAVTGMSSGRRVLELINSHRDVKDLIDRSGLESLKPAKHWRAY